MTNILILQFNKLAAVFNARLAQANLIKKRDFDAKLSNLNRKITQNKSKHLLVENELNKLKTFDSGYFIGKSHFGEDGTYLVFQPMHRYFKMIINTDYISAWKSKELKNGLFGAVALTKTADIDKYGYSGYGIEFDRRGSFSFPGGHIQCFDKV